MDNSKGRIKGSVCMPGQIFVSHFFCLILFKGVNEIKAEPLLWKEQFYNFDFILSRFQTYFHLNGMQSFLWCF